MVILWVLLALNGLLNILLLANPRAGADLSISPAWAAFNIFGFVVVATLSVVTYYRVTKGWVAATAISIFPLACGCITVPMAIELLTSLGRIGRAPRELTLEEWRSSKGRLKEIYKGQCSGFVTSGKWHPIRIRFFENAVLFLLARDGQHIVIDRAVANNCSISPRGSSYMLSDFPDQSDTQRKKLRIDDEGLRAWRIWVADA